MGLHEGFPFVNGLAKDSEQTHQQIMNERDSIKSPEGAGMHLNAIQLLLFISTSWEMLSS